MVGQSAQVAGIAGPGGCAAGVCQATTIALTAEEGRRPPARVRKAAATLATTSPTGRASQVRKSPGQG